jgi:actin-related protein
VIKDWEAMEKVIQHTLCNEMQGGNLYSTLFTERVFTPTAQRDKLSELMFERFDAPGLNFAMSEVLAVWAGGRNTALVVDVGASQFLLVFKRTPEVVLIRYYIR